jgi:large subunit ribosomal protein L11
MATQTVEALVNGGKATAAPPLGPALGPMGVNIGQVVAEINKKTQAFKGMQVPVKVNIDSDTKTFTITVGTPPTASLLKKEAGVEKGAGNPLADKVADLKIEQIIKVAQMKEDALLGKGPVQRVKEVIGTCRSMGILVEKMPAQQAIQAINKGDYKEKIESGKTELTAEELKVLEEEKKHLQEELKKKREQFTVTAKQIIEQMAGKPRGQIKTRLQEVKVPIKIIEELLPAETAAEKKPAAEKKTAPAKKK